jgi:beta-lactamase superfamily II metal-dependent hydrolase
MICSSEDAYDIGYCAVLGSGVGESIIIKIGINEWCVVDCHKIKIDDKLYVAPLYFLEKIGVNIATDIKFIFATHWDDDHISGISELLEKAKNAVFATTAVVTDKKFYGYLRTHHDNLKNTPHKSGINEFFECQGIIKVRKQKIKKLKQNELMYQNDCVDIYALSPHDDVINTVFDFLMKNNPNILNQPIKVCVPPKPNDTSVVLLIKFKILESQILLGADLEELDKKSWSKLIQDNAVQNVKAGIFKIPHHGSKNGYCKKSL